MANELRRRTTKKGNVSSPPKSVSVTVTLPPEMARRVQRFEKHLRQLRSNLRITRAGLIRALIERGLIAFEHEERQHAESSRRGGPKPLAHR